MTADLRLFVDLAHDGPTNMAIDACLLAAAEAGAATLRLYRWSPPTLSLGYFQCFDDPARRQGALASLPVVRRCTGGGAILHADELTYSLALPNTHSLAGRRAEDLYSWAHERVAEATAMLGGAARPKGGDEPGSARGGPFLCFLRHARFDLMAGAAKLAGSAQRRAKTALLQHGSVVLRRTHPAQPSGSVSESVGRVVTFEQFADAMVAAIRAVGVTLSEPTASQVDLVALDAERQTHLSDRWLRKR